MLRLIGIWKLLFIDHAHPTNGTPTHRTNVTGRITFTADGYMNALIQDPVTAYCGMYTVHNESGQIYTRTKLDVSLNQSWMLQDQIRYATFEEVEGKTRMTLIPFTNGTLADNRLTWEKVTLPPVTMA